MKHRECYDLSDALATGARLWLDVQNEIRQGGVRGQVAAMTVARSLDSPARTDSA